MELEVMMIFGAARAFVLLQHTAFVTLHDQCMYGRS